MSSSKKENRPDSTIRVMGLPAHTARAAFGPKQCRDLNWSLVHLHGLLYFARPGNTSTTRYRMSWGYKKHIAIVENMVKGVKIARQDSIISCDHHDAMYLFMSYINDYIHTKIKATVSFIYVIICVTHSYWFISPIILNDT